MVWVPKKSSQTKNDVQASIATSTTKVKKEKESHKKLSWRFSSTKNNLRLALHSYSSNMPLMPFPWNSSAGMIGSSMGLFWSMHAIRFLTSWKDIAKSFCIRLAAILLLIQKGQNTLLVVPFIYFSHTCFGGWILCETYGDGRYLPIVLRIHVNMADVVFWTSSLVLLEIEIRCTFIENMLHRPIHSCRIGKWDYALAEYELAN